MPGPGEGFRWYNGCPRRGAARDRDGWGDGAGRSRGTRPAVVWPVGKAGRGVVTMRVDKETGRPGVPGNARGGAASNRDSVRSSMLGLKGIDDVSQNWALGFLLSYRATRPRGQAAEGSDRSEGTPRRRRGRPAKTGGQPGRLARPWQPGIGREASDKGRRSGKRTESERRARRRRGPPAGAVVPIGRRREGRRSGKRSGAWKPGTASGRQAPERATRWARPPARSLRRGKGGGARVERPRPSEPRPSLRGRSGTGVCGRRATSAAGSAAPCLG